MVTFNPFVMTNVPDGFSVQSQGFWQGDLQADPAQRFQLVAGVVDSAETLPMWGGVGIFEATVASTTGQTGQGPTIGRAANVGELAGFTTFQGSFSAPTTPQSTVPLQSNGGGFNFVRFGSLSRIVLACNSSVLALAGTKNPQKFSWDYTNQVLIPGDGTNEFDATLLEVNAGNSAVVVYNSGTGFATWNTAGNAALILI